MSGRSFVDRLRTAGGPSHDLLVLLDRHRVLTTGQLARATGAPVRTVRYRLDRLRTTGLVDAVRPGRETGSAPRHWWLRPAGARLVVGTAAAEGRRPSGMFVAHSAAIAEVWLVLREHGPAAGLRLVDWWADRAGWQEWETRTPGYGTRLRRLTPDAVALVDVDHDGVAGQAVMFVEVDLATMTQVLLREKVNRYLAYAADRAWEGVWPHCPPLLLLTTTASRAATFVAAAGKMVATARRQAGWYGGQPGRDIAAADALVVAACGLVREPADAVTETVWLLPQEAAAQVSLPELLAERITAQARAQHWHDLAEAEVRRQQLIDQLDVIARTNVGQLLAAPTAGEVFEYLVGRNPRGLAETEPELVNALLVWWADRDDPHHVDRARQLLLTRHHQEWTRQARVLLAAVNRHGDQPRLCAAAARLQQQRLLDSPVLVEHLEDPPARTRRQIQDTALTEHVAARDDAVATVYERMSWRARRRTTIAELAAAYDTEHLVVCDTCAIAVPRPELDDWQPDVCEHCHTGRLLDYDQHDQIPTLTQRCDTIRAQLAT